MFQNKYDTHCIHNEVLQNSSTSKLLNVKITIPLMCHLPCQTISAELATSHELNEAFLDRKKISLCSIYFHQMAYTQWTWYPLAEIKTWGELESTFEGLPTTKHLGETEIIHSLLIYVSLYLWTETKRSTQVFRATGVTRHHNHNKTTNEIYETYQMKRQNREISLMWGKY